MKEKGRNEMKELVSFRSSCKAMADEMTTVFLCGTCFYTDSAPRIRRSNVRFYVAARSSFINTTTLSKGMLSGN